jgi:hypothetical protein
MSDAVQPAEALTPKGPPAAANRAKPQPIAGGLGLLWPGLGLLVRGQVAASLLANWAVGHCLALLICDLAAFASRGEETDAVLSTALRALERGVVNPQSGLLAALAVTVHLGSAWSAWKGSSAESLLDEAPRQD